MSEVIQRRLAAILAADIAGYSRLMGADENATLAAMRSLRDDCFTPQIASSGGTVVKSMGDGWLVEFASVVQAVNCAIAVQRAIADHPTIKLRMGVHIGDIVHADNDIYGDGVNIAARLQEVSAPGGIMISAFAHAAVKGAIEDTFHDAGERRLKNIMDGVGTYYWGEAPDASPADQAALGPQRPTIAVMPFVNQSEDKEQDVFAIGITEDLTAELDGIDWLKVTWRNLAAEYRGLDLPATQIAEELNVRYLLEGSVRRAGSRLRVTTRLLRAEGAEQIWAESFDGSLADIFDFQDQICRKVMGSVDTGLRHAERNWARRKPAENLGAWEYYHRGQYTLYNRRHNDSLAALPDLLKALELAPTFSSPHAAIADCYYHNVIMSECETDEEAENALALAYDHARRAVDLDDEDAIGHSMLGRVEYMRGEYDLSKAAFENALKLNPHFALSHMGLASLYIWTGNAEASLGILDTAIDLSPRDNLMWGFYSWKSAAYLNLYRYHECEEVGRKCIALKPHIGYGHLNLSLALYYQGRGDEAANSMANAIKHLKDFSVSRFRRALPRIDNEYLEHWLNGCRALGVPE